MYNMSLTVKKFENKDLNVSIDAYVNNKQNICFKGKDITTSLGYKDTDKAIRNHVKDKYKTIINPPNRRGNPSDIYVRARSSITYFWI